MKEIAHHIGKVRKIELVLFALFFAAFISLINILVKVGCNNSHMSGKLCSFFIYAPAAMFDSPYFKLNTIQILLLAILMFTILLVLKRKSAFHEWRNWQFGLAVLIALIVYQVLSISLNSYVAAISESKTMKSYLINKWYSDCETNTLITPFFSRKYESSIQICVQGGREKYSRFDILGNPIGEKNSGQSL